MILPSSPFFPTPNRDLEIPPRNLTGARVLIVLSCFYEDIAQLLYQGALSVLEEAGTIAELVQVPGALEIPLAAAIAYRSSARTGHPYAGILSLGCVVRGETYHFEMVAHHSIGALMTYGMQENIPLGQGILTVESLVQAKVRADPNQKNKGGEAAEAVLNLMRLQRFLEGRG